MPPPASSEKTTEPTAALPDQAGITISRSVVVRRLLLGVVAVNVVLIGLAVIWIDQSRHRYEAIAETTTENISLMMAEHIADELSRIDLTVLTVVDEVEQQLAAPEGINPTTLTAFIKRHFALLPAIDGLRVVNAEGENAYGIGIKPGPRSSVADRPYFQRLRSDPKAGLVISDPVVGRVSKKWSIILARRVNRPDGSFGGLVYGTITLDQFSATLGSVNVGTNGLMTLRNEALALVARYPVPKDFEQVVGTQNSSLDLKKSVQANPEEGNYRTNLGFEAGDRIVSYKKVPQAPFYLIVSLGEDEFLSPWRSERSKVAAFTVLFSLLSILGTGLIYRSWMRRTAAAQALTQSNEELDAAKRRAEMLALVATHTTNSVVITDAQRRITWANEGFTRLSGYSLAEALGRIPGDIVRSPHADPLTVTAIHTARVEGKGFRGELLNRNKAGQDYWVDLDIVPLYAAGGELTGYIGIHLDITARKEAEHELREKEARLSLATIHSGVGIWEWDLITNKMAWDDSMFALYHIRREDFSGTEEAWRKSLHPDDLARGDQETADAIAGKKPFDTAFRVVWPNGEIRHIKGVAKVFFDEQGTPVRMLGTNWDITEHMQAESALFQSREQLRALSVHLQSLRETERTRIAREIHDELGQMLTGLKMELQAAESRLEELKDARFNPILDKLVAATEVADATITTVQRIASELRPGVLDRLGLMQALRHEIDQFQQRTGIACQLSAPEEDPGFHPEVATTLYRIFQEALTNVARHAAASAVHVRCDTAHGWFTLEVQDDGRGMDEAAPNRPGALGIVGMQERAHLTGGTVTFHRANSGGTVVSVRLPQSPPPPTRL